MDISLETMVPIGMILLSFALAVLGFWTLQKHKIFFARRLVYTALIMFGLSTGALIYQVFRYLYVNA